MIDVKNLMIGNNIKANDVYQGKIMTFDRFNEDKTVVFFSDGHKWGIGEYVKDCEPIVLSEQILLKCGFEFIFGDGQNDSLYVKKNDANKIIFQITDRFTFRHSSYNGTTITYLHELQNLYKILTKQELKIKL